VGACVGGVRVRVRATPLVLWLPKPPDNANGRKHWAVALREKKALWAELDNRKRTKYHFEHQPYKPLRRVMLSVEWVADRAAWLPDKDNITRRLKPVVDWLVARHYLEGDTAELVSWADHVVRVGTDKPPLCTVKLSISEVAI